MAKRTRRTPTTPKNARSQRAIRVRMYRQGLGDCFLVTLPKDDGSPFCLMIDCGVILGTQSPNDIMTQVVDDIIATTGGYIDLLAVTHEHWDHVSGFIQAQQLFSKATEERKRGRLSVGEVWFPWTEDPSDKLAGRLRKDRAERVRKLAGFVEALSSTDINSPEMQLVEGVKEVLSFFGIDGKSKKAASTTGAAMEFARQLANKVRYCRPTDSPTELPGVKNIRLYVLGPPQDEGLLRKTDSAKEVYHLANVGAAASFFAAATDALPEMGRTDKGNVQDEIDRHHPFDRTYRLPLKSVEGAATDRTAPSDTASEFFDRYYFGRTADPLAPDQSWRRIDGSWLGAAAEFALQLDSATNNTSLVLALEVVDSGKVLLFVADAQVGNWLSWPDLSWQPAPGRTVKGIDLMKRTVFYKVGHHGSHNATLKAKGLELMRADDLVAFIPVDHKMAIKKHWNRMPLPNLVKDLKIRTKGRLVRIDEDYQVPSNDDGTAAAFAKSLTMNALFYEWTMPLG